MTEQYIVGEFSSLLGELTPTARGTLLDVARALRRRVECGPRRLLPALAHEALDLSDALCWAALEQGDLDGFRRCAGTSAALADFGAGAGLLP
jgi:hypothetical protein